MAREVKDLTGVKVGRITVLRRAPDRFTSSGKRRVYWECTCSCGNPNTFEVRSDGITGKTSNSCGCLRDEAAKEQIKKAQAVGYKKPLPDLVGEVFGRLTVREPAPRTTTPKGRELPRWFCDCSCGNEVNVLHDSLLAGKATSCGCVLPSYVGSDFSNKTEIFIHRAKELHGDKYDYSLVEFEHSQKKVLIVCSKHGSFSQKPSNHLTGHGCPACARVSKVSVAPQNLDENRELTCSVHAINYTAKNGCLSCFEDSVAKKTADFIERSKKVHGNKYDYSMSTLVYLKDKVTIGCSIHGEFSQQATLHVGGQGCPECGRLSKLIGTEDFIKRSIEVHGNRFDYSKVVYEHSNVPVEIVCKNHGSFFQKPAAHLNGQKCKRCAGEDRASKQHWNYVERCKLNPELGNSDGVLYILGLQKNDESFIKVGVTKNLTKRVGHYREFGLSVDVIKSFDSTCLQTAYWEKDLLRFIRENDLKYLPTCEFKGWTECARLDSLDQIIDFTENLVN